MKKGSQAISTNTHQELERKSDLLAALNQAAVFPRGKFDSESDLLHAYCDQLTQMNLIASISFLDDLEETIEILAITGPEEFKDFLKIHDFESVVGRKFPLTDIPSYRERSASGQPSLSAAGEGILSKLIQDHEQKRNASQPAPYELPSIVSFFRAGQNVRGFMEVTGPDLHAGDISAVQAYANLIAITLENVRLSAAQAATAMQNEALLDAERQQRQEAETLRQATAALASSLELDALLDEILLRLEQVVPYDSAAVLFQEKDHLTIVAGRGFPDMAAVIGKTFPIQDDLGQEILQTRRPLIIPDTRRDTRFKQWVETSYVRGWMGVPLIIQGKIIGYLTCDSRQVAAYNESDAERAQAFASHAAIAIENSRLFKTLGQRAAELEAVHKTSLSLTASLELPQVLHSILRSTLTLLPEAENAHIFLYNAGEKDDLNFGAALWADGTENRPWIKPRPHGLTHTVARIGETILVSDMRQHEIYQNTPPDWKGAILGLPLKIGKRVVGVMNIKYSQCRDFSEAEIRVLRLFGDQAAIAIENARLFEQAATERRHLGLLYDISRDISASLDPDEILDRAISLTCMALDGLVGQAFLYLPDKEILSRRALYGQTQVSLEEINRRIQLRKGIALAGWVAETLTPVAVPDVTVDPRWLHISCIDDKVHSAIAAPILVEEELLGVLMVQHQEIDAFSEGHLDLLQAICRETGLALSNARRYQQVQRRLAEMTLIQSLVNTFNQRLELRDLLDSVAVQLAEKLGYPQVDIYLVEEDSLVLGAYQGQPPLNERKPLSSGLLGKVAQSGQPMLITDSEQMLAEESVLPDVQAQFAVPILRGKVVIGLIHVQTDHQELLDRQEQELLQILAGQISIALENAVLFERVRRHAEDLEHIVAQRTAELTELYELSQEISYQLSFEELLRLLLRHLRNATGSELVIGGLYTSDFRCILLESSRPLKPTVLKALDDHWKNLFPDTNWLPSDETSSFQWLRSEDYQDDSPPIQQITHHLEAPIIIDQNPVGILMAASESSEVSAPEKKRLITTLANQAAAAVQRLQALLAAQQKHLENLVEHLPIGIVLLDADFNLLVANPYGREILSILSPSYSHSPLVKLGERPIQDLIAGQKEPLPIEIELDGASRQYFEAQIRLIVEEKHQWVLTLREVTQEREYQSRIQSQERLATVGQLAAGIAHDFNNIMAAILVYADLLRHDEEIPLSSREKLTIIQQQVERAATLIRQILDFSRRSIMEQSALDLLPFIKELDRMLARVLPETISLELTYRPSTYWVNVDPTRLQQVFINLAVNARDAMPEGGRLHFEIGRFQLKTNTKPPIPKMKPGNWVRIIVKDTGVGIPKEILPRIFDPFFTTKPVGQGTGLGLAQVYGIIKQHEGFIDVQSKPGEGASFLIYLPELEVSSKKQEEDNGHFRLEGSGETVLLVEDNQATRQAIKTMLETQNYKVVSATNGLEALEHFERTSDPVALVISDVVMPQMGGVALYKALMERRSQVKMLFVTGHPMENQDQALLESKSVHWLQKPFSIADFNKAVSVLMEEGGS